MYAGHGKRSVLGRVPTHFRPESPRSRRKTLCFQYGGCPGRAPICLLTANSGLVERCGRLPLALRAAGSYLRTRPGLAVDAYLALLADERKRLEALRVPRAGLDVGAALRLSVAALEEDDPTLAQRWRTLAVFPAGFLPDAAAAVWEVGEDEAAAALDELVGRALVSFEGGSGRYRLHDLVRDLAAGELDEAVREEAAAGDAAHYVTVLRRA